jgi:hypothetical protein
VLGPSLSNTLGRREAAAGLALAALLLAVLLLSDMVLEFSTVTFRLILDILQDWEAKTQPKSEQGRTFRQGKATLYTLYIHLSYTRQTQNCFR